MHQSHVINGSNHRPMALDLDMAKSSNAPLLVFCHGFKGFKDWGHFPLLASKFASSGISFARFNFSHNGTTIDRPEDFDDLEAFGNNNFSFEQFDLGLVIDFLEEQRSKGEISYGPLWVLGHSRGGACAILRAGQDERVHGLVTWASINRYGRYWDEQTMSKWKETGVNFVYNGRTKQNMPLYWQLYEDYYANESSLDVEAAVKRIEKPFLVIHGQKDEAVSVDSAKQMKEWNQNLSLFLVEEGNHTFSGKHPWTGTDLSEDMEKVFQTTLAFVNEQS